MSHERRWDREFWLPLLPMCILILIFPLAVAGQNIGAGIAIICLAAYMAKRKACPALLCRSKQFLTPLSLAFLMTASILFSTSLNTLSPPAEPWRYVASHLIWNILPFSLVLLGPISHDQWQVLRKLALVVAAIFGIAALSQHFFPWQVHGVHFVEGTIRARGFYSHPLTFAYAVFLMWPLVIGNLLEYHKSLLSWFAFIGVGAALILSESRTILLVTAGILAYNVLFRTRGGMRTLLAAIGISACALVTLTSNQLAEKIQLTYSSQGFDRNTEYRDDRIAFWHAHLKMVEEKPVFGHGIDLSPEYLTPYYVAIGLGDFSKKYPAHNMFLQVLVNAGVVGLGLFLAWYVSVAQIAWRRRNDLWGYHVFLQTWIGLAVVSMTQNAFQDSEVRYGMALAVAAIWLGAVREVESQTNEVAAP